ncbi:MAG: immunoglobulin domain-containing protein [Phycisphaerae bacterium]|nr:immunoglobulin domain-containing protein [Phycisphaerae bacterium]
MKKIICLFLTTILVVTAAVQAELVHRYSFEKGAIDSVGTANLNVNGAAIVADGVLDLPGGDIRTNNANASGAALTELANTINSSAAITMEFWFNQDAHMNWSKLMMLGASTEIGTNAGLYMDVTPRRGIDGNVGSCSINDSLHDEENVITSSQLGIDVEYYMAAIWDTTNDEMAIIVAEVGNPASMAIRTKPMGGQQLSDVTIEQFYLGSAVGFGDQDINAQIDEFRIYNHAMTETEINNSIASGPAMSVQVIAPVDGAVDIDFTSELTLDWDLPLSYGGTISEYQVYFGSDKATVESAETGYVAVTAPVTELVVLATEISSDSEYFWRVDYIGIDGAGDDPNVFVTPAFSFQTKKTLPIITGPVESRVNSGENVEFTVGIETESAVTAVTWFKEVSEGQDIELSGTKYTAEFSDTEAKLSIADAQEADAGNYYCKVTNSAGQETSVAAGLFIKHVLAYWNFDEGTGLDVADSQGNIDCVIATSETNTGAQWVIEGFKGSAILFDGINDSLIIADDPNNVPSGNPLYSIVAWVKPVTTSGSRGIIGWGNYGGGRQVNAFKLAGNQIVNYWWGADLGANTGDVDITDGDWHMAAVSFDGTTRTVWLDGAKIGSDNPGVNNLPESGPNFAIGVTNLGEFFEGLIDEVSLYDYGLNEMEIAQMYYAETGNSVCVNPVEFDLNNDCIVNLADFKILASSWLQCGLVPESACDNINN